MGSLERLLSASQAIIAWDEGEVWDLHNWLVITSNLKQAIAEVKEVEPETCQWKILYGSLWRTGCGTDWVIDRKNPNLAGFVYCPSCGKRVRAWANKPREE